MNKGWIGVDLDGTLAHYDERHGMERIGAACVPMLRRVHQWLAAGIEVRIVTARAGDPSLKSSVTPWLRDHNLAGLVVTHRRDPGLLQLWDDRAVQVEMNTGTIMTPRQYVPLVPSGWLGVEFDGVLAQVQAGERLPQPGDPVPAMLNRVRQWLMVGIDVRVFSNRAADPDQLTVVENWLAANGLSLPVTCEKDFQMSVFYDARAVHVIHNSGEPSVSPDPVLP